MKLCICDDHPEDVDRIRTLTTELIWEYPQWPIQVQSFSSPFDLLEYLETGRGFDLYLLDILMPHMSGLDLAKQIRQRGEKAEILFLTSSREYAIDAFRVKASGYLLKPLEKEAFFEAVLSCIHTLTSEKNAFLLIKIRGGLRKVCLQDLVLIESFNHSRVCTLKDGSKLETAATLSSLMEQLGGDGRFFSPHRAYIVNLEYVSGLNPSELMLTDGKKLPVSRKLYADLKTAYMNYVF